MPELPEVEYVARQLRETLVGRRVVGVAVRWERALGGMAADEFTARLTGQRVTRVGRRAKYLLLYLDGGEVLAIHRRMSGNLYLPKPADESEDPYTRVALALDDGRTLVYSDPRKFGRLVLLPASALDDYFAALGPEPLEPEFTPEALAARLAHTHRPIKAALLDQSIVAGLGNIYADEALFRAQIHPLRPADALTRDEVARLRDAIQAVLLTGIEHGGTTFGRYRDAYNEAGMNREHLQVYQHTGQPCPVCGTPIQRITVAQRSTHFCPHCQSAICPPHRRTDDVPHQQNAPSPLTGEGG